MKLPPYQIDPAHSTRYQFFTGKGGVGKTSLSCATALRLAESGRRVLLVSTDPASNLDEVLETTLTNVPAPIAGAPGLHALNINPVAAAAAYRERLIGPLPQGPCVKAAVAACTEAKRIPAQRGTFEDPVAAAAAAAAYAVVARRSEAIIGASGFRRAQPRHLRRFARQGPQATKVHPTAGHARPRRGARQAPGRYAGCAILHNVGEQRRNF